MGSASGCPAWAGCGSSRAGGQRVASAFRPSSPARPAACEVAAPTMGIATLKRRAEFLRVRGGKRYASANFVLEGRARHPAQQGLASGDSARFGFTVTKKIGGAVVRNRIRRRLKEALRSIAPRAALPGHDYVLIARVAAAACDFEDLKSDLARALQKVNVTPDKTSDGGSSGSGRKAHPSRRRTQSARLDGGPQERTGARDS